MGWWRGVKRKDLRLVGGVFADLGRLWGFEGVFAICSGLWRFVVVVAVCSGL